MNLSLLLFLPLLTALAVLFSKGLKQVRTISFIGAALQLILGFVLLYLYWQERSSGNNASFLLKLIIPGMLRCTSITTLAWTGSQ